METVQLTQLEKQVEVLLNSLQFLRYENIALKEKLKQSLGSHAQLESKNQKAVTHIRKIITQLKEERS